MLSFKDLNIEKAILATFLFDPIKFEEYEVNSNVFYDPNHQNIYKAMQSLHKNDNPIDEEFIAHELDKNKNYNEDALLSILATNPISAVSEYINKLIELYRQRELNFLSIEIKKHQSNKLDSSDILKEINNKHNYIDNIGTVGEIENLLNLKQRVESKPKMPKFATGLKWLDDNLNGGFTEGSFVNLAGESFGGKSTLALQILKNISEYNPVLFFSFEMYENLFYEKIKDCNSTQLCNFMVEQKRNDLSAIVAIIKQKSKDGVRFVVVDSRMKIRVTGKSEEYQKNSEISSVLSKLCQELGLVLILINQIAEQDLRNKRLALKGSGDQLYDSDVIFFITVSTDDDGHKTRTLRCTKDRHNGKSWNVDIPDFSKTYYNGADCEIVHFKGDITNIEAPFDL